MNRIDGTGRESNMGLAEYEPTALMLGHPFCMICNVDADEDEVFDKYINIWLENEIHRRRFQDSCKTEGLSWKMGDDLYMDYGICKVIDKHCVFLCSKYQRFGDSGKETTDEQMC